jgi:hypothetical protein
MPGIIEGYNYDLFISYRQNDNKNNGWVSEFVDNLRKEIETLSKEEVKIYFDINPRDGLLDTHDVNGTIREKLKSLVFIPVLSRTYCDTHSYAWENEFKAFIDTASGDTFGLKTILQSGNVASRVLPVRIHDLTQEDVRLAETYLGIIRSVDFIYRSKGVNRPLRPWDDDVIKNTEQPLYRDQINKLAHAVIDILHGIRRMHNLSKRERTSAGVNLLSHDQGKYLEYTGPVNPDIINMLLGKLKSNNEFENLNKTTAKKVYALASECLDNISRYSLKDPGSDETGKPYISIRKISDKIIINTGNPVPSGNAGKLLERLDHLNDLDDTALKKLHDERISEDQGIEDGGIGLGFILMFIKSGNRISYSLEKKNEYYSYLELKITINIFFGGRLLIEASQNSPKVHLDADKKFFEISGESRPEDVFGFYSLLLKWLDEFSINLLQSENEPDPLIFNFMLDYFNSSSSKYLLDICRKLSFLKNSGKNIVVKWHYERDDNDMLESGKEFSKIVKISFEYIERI